MALFDKLGSMTKNITDKTGDMLEITKLNSKINNEKTKISTLKTKIGEHYWSIFEAGTELDYEATELCRAIKDSMGAINALEAEIQKIKAGGKAEYSAPNTFTQQNTAPSSTPEAETTSFCENCGAALGKNEKFCSECGAPVTPR